MHARPSQNAHIVVQRFPTAFFERQARLTGNYSYAFTRDGKQLRQGDRSRILRELNTFPAEVAEELRFIGAALTFNLERLETVIEENNSLRNRLQEYLGENGP